MSSDPTLRGFKKPEESTSSVFRPAAAPGEVGRLANYRILRLIGKGGMGQVYEAEDLVLRRPVALKIMNPDLPDSAAAGERFLREARALASISHENLVPVYQAGEENGVFYLAMPLLQGETLHARLASKGPPPPAEMLRVAREIAAGLAAIHARGLVHRDLKPTNIWIEAPRGRARILDFGLAKAVDAPSELTATGMVVGTPAFMAPEQARGQAVDARSDLFSLGAVLYCLCTGKQPFVGDTLMAQLTALAVDTPPPVRASNPTAPERLSVLISRLLSKDPEKRPASAELVLDLLDVGGTRKLVRKAKAKAVPLAVAALLLTGLALAFAFRPTGEKSPGVISPPPAKAPQGTSTFLLELVRDEDPKDGVWFPAESGKKSRPIVPGPPNAFRRMILGHDPSPNGIGMHPSPEGAAFLEARLEGRFKRFRARVGQNVGPGPLRDPMIFALRADGKALWRSKPNLGDPDVEDVDVDVSGVKVLRLELACEGEPRGAHGLWFEPRLD